jgi:predicted DsbA family dithiol-disulfide isomerase
MRATIRQRGADVGFDFNPAGRGRVYNTFDAHRLLTWAERDGGKQHALKKALLVAYHGEAQNMESHAVLARIAGEVGLDVARAQAILATDEYASETREREQFYTSAGIRAVPSVIINDRHLIQGGQPPEAFEQALRQIAAEAA